MRHVVRRLRTSEAGSGTVEYAVLIAVIAIGLMGVLALFGNAVGGVTNRTTASVSARAAGGYGTKATGRGGASSGGPIAFKPGAEPDSAATEPDSSATDDGTPAVTLDLAVP